MLKSRTVADNLIARFELGKVYGATVIAVFFIPMFYYVIESMSERFGGRKQAPAIGETDALASGGSVATAAAHAPHEG